MNRDHARTKERVGPRSAYPNDATKPSSEAPVLVRWANQSRADDLRVSRNRGSDSRAEERGWNKVGCPALGPIALDLPCLRAYCSRFALPYGLLLSLCPALGPIALDLPCLRAYCSRFSEAMATRRRVRSNPKSKTSTVLTYRSIETK